MDREPIATGILGTGMVLAIYYMNASPAHYIFVYCNDYAK